MAELKSPDHYLVPDRLEYAIQEVKNIQERIDKLLSPRRCTDCCTAMEFLAAEMLQEMEESPVLMLARICQKRADWLNRFNLIKEGVISG
jgi:hypothetical protein